MAALGNNILISQGSTVIAGTKSNELNVDCEVVEISDASQGQWKKFITGRREWSMTVSFLVTTVKTSDARSPLNVGESYTLHFGTRGSSSDTVSGTAICTQCKITATYGNLCQGTITFKGSGPLS
jgi:predicted secreted protein